jgi:hypothetical protein
MMTGVPTTIAIRSRPMLLMTLSNLLENDEAPVCVALAMLSPNSRALIAVSRAASPISLMRWMTSCASAAISRAPRRRTRTSMLSSMPPTPFSRTGC